MSALKNEDLMLAYRKGEDRAFDEIYRRLAPRVYGYLGEATDGEVDDAFLAAFVKLHETRRKYAREHELELWLYVIARNALMDQYRRQGREALFDQVVASEIDRPELPAGGDLSGWEASLTVLEDVAPEQRQAIETRILREMECEEIATRLGRARASLMEEERFTDFERFKSAARVVPPREVTERLFTRLAQEPTAKLVLVKRLLLLATAVWIALWLFSQLRS